MEEKRPPLRTLQDMLSLLRNDKNYKEAIKYGTNNYATVQYKINKIRLQEISELVTLIEVNYINLEKQMQTSVEKKKNSWLANELKLFVWMSVCHSYLSNKPLEEYDETQWEFFTNILTRKTSNDLDFQSKSLFKNYKGNKQKWDEQEQQLLKTILQDDKYQNKWNQVSRVLYFQSNKKYYRSSQKCREYWFNHLDERLNKSAWTIEEDLKLVGELLSYGFKWSKLTQVIESTWGYRRTEHMVKNRTKLLCRKYGYKDQKQQGCMKQLKMIEKKLREQQQKQRQQSSTVLITQVKQQQFEQQKFLHSNQKNVPNYGGESKSDHDINRNQKEDSLLQREGEKMCVESMGQANNYQSDMILKQAQNNLNSSRNHIGGSINKVSQQIVKDSQQQHLKKEKMLEGKKDQLNKNNGDESYSQSQSQSQGYSSQNGKVNKKNKYNKNNKNSKNSKKNIKNSNNNNTKSRKAKRPIKKVSKKMESSQQFQSQQQQSYESKQQSSQQSCQQQFDEKRQQKNKRRSVIILYQADKKKKKKQQQQNQQEEQHIAQQQQQQSSSEPIIGQHIQQQQQQKGNRQYQPHEEQHNKYDPYYDEYNIIQEVPDQRPIDFNEDIQFQHDTHGGKMRERVTHQLAKYFPTDNNN